MLLALDLGTNALKAGLFDLTGRPQIIVRRQYAVHYLADGGAEQDPNQWWAAVCDALREIFAENGYDVKRVAAICVIGQGPTLVVTDEDLRLRAPALLWLDHRDADERQTLSKTLGYEVSAYSLLPKIAWLARRRPEIFEQRARVTQAYDFIAARLAGRPFASSFGPWPPFSADEFKCAALDPHWIPTIAPMGEQVGVTRAPWCIDAHLPEGIPIVAGVYDAIATTLGTALVEPGRASDYGGGSGGYGLCWSAPLQAEGIAAWPGLCEGQFIVGGATASAGTSIEWFARTFGGAERLPELLTQAQSIAPGVEGLIYLPYLTGVRTPIWDDELRGAFVGFALHHRRAHLARAVLEAVALELRHIATCVASAGGQMNELRLCGGTARYELLNQIKADVLGVPVIVPRVIEASLLGASMMGAVGVRLQPAFAVAAEMMVHMDRRLEPEPNQRERYDVIFRRFLELSELRLK